MEGAERSKEIVEVGCLERAVLRELSKFLQRTSDSAADSLVGGLA